MTVEGVDERKQETLVRIPVRVAQAAPDTTVRIDPGLVQLRREGLATNSPFVPETGVWNESSQSGEWLIALSAPEALGKLDPRTLDLQIDLRGAGFDITLRRGQVRNGKAVANTGGEAILSWNNASGPQKTGIQLNESDVDANGWVWLLLSVNPGATADAFAVAAPWQVQRFDPTITGTVTGAPQPLQVARRKAATTQAAHPREESRAQEAAHQARRRQKATGDEPGQEARDDQKALNKKL